MSEQKQLHILWTNADVDTSLHMVLMYATNAMLRHFWDGVTVIIWGGTAKLAAENDAVRQKMALAMHAGVRFSACTACAENLGVAGELRAMGVEVISWGQPLTELLQSGAPLLTV